MAGREGGVVCPWLEGGDAHGRRDTRLRRPRPGRSGGARVWRRRVRVCPVAEAMKRIVIGASGIAALAIAAIPGWRWWQADRAEQQHADRNETEVRTGLTQRPYELYETGPSLERARLLRQDAPGSLWIGAGSYFMTVRDGARNLHYPVPILGYRLGPDRDGAF